MIHYPLVLAAAGLAGVPAPSDRFRNESFDPTTLATRIVVADLNGDGAPDTATIDFETEELRTYLNDGEGRFARAFVAGAGRQPSDLDAGDLNGDGVVDLVVVARESRLILVYAGRGDGTFASPKRIDVGAFQGSTALADFDGDGLLDIAAQNGGAVRVYTNRLSDGFVQTATLPISTGVASGVAAGDADGDGDPDILTTDPFFGRAVLFRNDGAGGFGAGELSDAMVSSFEAELVDLDGDGDLDAVITSSDSADAAVLRNTGGGLFAPPETILAGAPGAGLDVGDLDRDGAPDLLFATQRSLILHRGDGAGGLAPPEMIPIERSVGGAAIADVDGNATPDLVVASELTVLANPGNADFGLPRILPSTAVFGVVSADFNGDGIPDLASGESVPGRAVLRLGLGDGTFEEASAVGAGGLLRTTAAPDLDSDGDPDLVIAHREGRLAGPWTAEFFANDGGGTLDPIGSFVVDREDASPGFDTVSAADLDGDGQLETAISFGEAGLFLVPGDDRDGGASRVFLHSCDWQRGAVVSVSFGDINADGHPDLVFGGTCFTAEDPIEIYFGDGTGLAETPLRIVIPDPLPLRDNFVALRTVDLDRDGDDDILFTTRNDVWISESDGGVPGPPTPLGLGEALRPLGIADVDGNGTDDLVLLVHRSAFTVAYAAGDGAYTRSVDHPIPATSYGGVVADFDLDGDPDLVTGFDGTAFPEFLGGLAYSENDPAPDVPCSIADPVVPFGTIDLGDLVTFVAQILDASPAADFDGDGLADLDDIVAFVAAFTEGCP